MAARNPRKPSDPLSAELVRGAARGDAGSVRDLLSRGAKPEAKDPAIGPAICVAARWHHWEVVSALVRAGADVNAQDREYGYTPLCWAVLHGDLAAVRDLLDLRADPRVKDRWGNTALSPACDGIGVKSDERLDAGFCREVARLLLEAGCDPDEPNKGGMTPRMIALDPNLKGPVADLFRDLPPRAGVAPAAVPPGGGDATTQVVSIRGLSAEPLPVESLVAEDVLQHVRGLVRAGVATRAEMFEILLDEAGADTDADAARLHAELDREIARKAADEPAWPAVLDTDRLDKAFAALEERGVLCLHDAGYTQSDGFGDAEERREEEGGDESPFGAYCFYHRQDVEGAVAGRGLYLAFGSFASKKGELKIGRKITNALEEAGLRVEWDEDVSKRLLVPQFDFRRRGIPMG